MFLDYDHEMDYLDHPGMEKPCNLLLWDSKREPSGYEASELLQHCLTHN